MKKLLLLLVLFILCSCRATQVPIESKVEYTYRDSIRIIDSIVYVEIPKERIVDVVPTYDTLYLETSLAEANSYVDTTTHTLKGTIANKDTILPTTVKWVERIEYKDSIIVKEVPVEVTKEVTKYPTTYWIFLVVTVLVIAFIGFKIYLKIKK